MPSRSGVTADRGNIEERERTTMDMTIKEAIKHLNTYSSTMGSGQTDSDQHEEAKRVALDALRTLDTSVVIIGIDDEHNISINLNADIGSKMNNDDVSEDPSGQRYYAIEALIHAATHLAAEQVRDGNGIESVMEQLLESLCRNLESAMDVRIEVGQANIDQLREMVTDNKDPSMLS